MPAVKSKKKAAAKQKSAPTGPAPTETSQPRRLRLPAYRRFRLQRVKYPEHLPSGWSLMKQTIRLMWREKGLFLGIAAVYGVLNILFVRGLTGGTDVNNLKQQLNLTGAGQIVGGLSVFSTLLSSSGTGATASGGAYQVFLAIIVSLATIWAARQVTAGQHAGVREVFYKGMYPLVPAVLVMAAVLLQTLPFLVGGFLFSLVENNGIAVALVEHIIIGSIFIILLVISVYMLCSSIFALYIVTLPDMTPMKALRSARQLVRYRRLQVLRKLIFLPVFLLVVAILVLVPVIMFVAPIAFWVFFIMATLALLIVHVYMYTLYKELLA